MISEYVNIQDKAYMTTAYGITFYFTSEKRSKAFEERLPGVLTQLRTRMLNQYHVDVNCEVLAALKAYMSTELRDFFVEFNGVSYTHPLDLPLAVGLSG